MNSELYNSMNPFTGEVYDYKIIQKLPQEVRDALVPTDSKVIREFQNVYAWEFGNKIEREVLKARENKIEPVDSIFNTPSVDMGTELPAPHSVVSSDNTIKRLHGLSERLFNIQNDMQLAYGGVSVQQMYTETSLSDHTITGAMFLDDLHISIETIENRLSDIEAFISGCLL